MEKGNYQISKQGLSTGMIVNAWHTVTYFNVSFGKQDQLQRVIEQLIVIENLNIDTKKQNIVKMLVVHS